MKTSWKYLVIGMVAGFFVLSSSAISENIKLSAIKPSSSGQALTDEQQAVLAVRKAKASVVSVIGKPKVTQIAPGFSFSKSTGNVSGTGFVVSSDGLVVTNNHVVEDVALEYFVVFADGGSFPARVAVLDRYDDLAILKIEASNLTPVAFGDSDSLETGQTVFAIGNSLGKYQNTVSRGVVSGLGRSIAEELGLNVPNSHNWIQTDAAISLGNSGGPLVNMLGEVVGLNTAVDTAGPSLSFAVPGNVVKDAVNQYQLFGKISRPFLGVQFTTVNALIQSSQNLPVSEGALIAALSGGAPAERAGIKVGDIIVAINNTKLDQKNTLDAVLQKLQAGNQIVVKLLRHGEILEMPVILGEFK